MQGLKYITWWKYIQLFLLQGNAHNKELSMEDE